MPRRVTGREVPRELMETIAHIMGPSSAAAQALASADQHDGPVRFYETTQGSILVEKLPKPVRGEA